MLRPPPSPGRSQRRGNRTAADMFFNAPSRTFSSDSFGDILGSSKGNWADQMLQKKSNNNSSVLQRCATVQPEIQQLEASESDWFSEMSEVSESEHNNGNNGNTTSRNRALEKKKRRKKPDDVRKKKDMLVPAHVTDEDDNDSSSGDDNENNETNTAFAWPETKRRPNEKREPRKIKISKSDHDRINKLKSMFDQSASKSGDRIKIKKKKIVSSDNTDDKGASTDVETRRKVKSTRIKASDGAATDNETKPKSKSSIKVKSTDENSRRDSSRSMSQLLYSAKNSKDDDDDVVDTDSELAKLKERLGSKLTSTTTDGPSKRVGLRSSLRNSATKKDADEKSRRVSRRSVDGASTPSTRKKSTVSRPPLEPDHEKDDTTAIKKSSSDRKSSTRQKSILSASTHSSQKNEIGGSSSHSSSRKPDPEPSKPVLVRKKSLDDLMAETAPEIRKSRKSVTSLQEASKRKTVKVKLSSTNSLPDQAEWKGIVDDVLQKRRQHKSDNAISLPSTSEKKVRSASTRMKRDMI